MTNLGENLIFLISQPRSGSTLLQLILNEHPEIHTLAEPWLMLHPLFALSSKGYTAEYDASLARKATKEFIQSLPGKEEDYYEGLRRMYTYLYERALVESGKQYFLDKTPRYYLIIPALYRTFPKARYIILFRNPLAVLNSILNTWTRVFLYRYAHDLLQGPRLLLEGVDVLGAQKIVVRYEKLVGEPERELRKIFGWLELDFDAGFLEYGHGTSFWQFGDKEGINQYTRPVSQSIEKWAKNLDDPQVWRLAHAYLQLLGQETVEQMGYSYKELMQALVSCKPNKISLWFTLSLNYYLRKPINENIKWRRFVARLTKSFQKRGVLGTARAGIQEITERWSI